MIDLVLLWNGIALEANRVSHTNGKGEQAGPPLSARALAIVHLAMYDALAGVVQDAKDFPRYADNGPLYSGAVSAVSEAEAITGAAHVVLSSLFKSQSTQFDLVRDLLRSSGDRDEAAFQFGVTVGQSILSDRDNDPGVGSATYRSSDVRGGHRPDPDNSAQGFHAPDYGRLCKGFGITNRFELAAPPFDNPEYLAALKDVRAKGIKPELIGTLPDGYDSRTPEETMIGIYWGYDGAPGLGTPPRLYNQIVRVVASAQQNDMRTNARLFAFVNVAMADAGILAWDQKYKHDFWRPVVGLREHDRSMGPNPTQPGDTLAQDCDPGWLPLGAPSSNRIGKNFTPNFPAYPSGHATFGAAALHMTRLFYGQGGTLNGANLQPDNLFVNLSFESEELNGTTTDNAGAVRPNHRRTFPEGLWQMIEENGRSRVYLGVHWIFDAFSVNRNGIPRLYNKSPEGHYVGGVPLGLQIAEDIYSVNGRAPAKSPVGPRPEVAMKSNKSSTYSSRFLE